MSTWALLPFVAKGSVDGATGILPPMPRIVVVVAAVGGGVVATGKEFGVNPGEVDRGCEAGPWGAAGTPGDAPCARGAVVAGAVWIGDRVGGGDETVGETVGGAVEAGTEELDGRVEGLTEGLGVLGPTAALDTPDPASATTMRVKATAADSNVAPITTRLVVSTPPVLPTGSAAE